MLPHRAAAARTHSAPARPAGTEVSRAEVDTTLLPRRDRSGPVVGAGGAGFLPVPHGDRRRAGYDPVAVTWCRGALSVRAAA
ncbi:hypothetical protein NUM_39820 [Actinocatenispora comari]|uniref:Uncharacterized protein n=1 Tax=Actinocatenispora comari TaxID=2807577 RepID=A0A8J4AHD9_9ACTN|nr:hypothetical protein NUM_39820 [Actinocatenispora comari]